MKKNISRRHTIFFAICVSLALSFQAVAQSGIISTFAGNGAAASWGDGGAATVASINHPIGIARDGSGNIYVAENQGHRIRKITPSGIISTVAGTGTAGYSGDGGPATSAKLFEPYWVDVDNSGNLYIADAFNNRIRKVSPSGIITTIAGTGVGSYTGDGGAATAATLYTPTCVRVDNAGNVFFTDNSNNAIRKISTTGIITTVAGNGTLGFSGDGGPATLARLHNPSSVWPDAVGNLYISDAQNNRIRKVNTSGIITTIAGTGGTSFAGDGGPATAAQLQVPQEAIMNAAGDLYIADNWHHRVRKVSPSGIITTVAGTTMGFSGDGGPATAAKLNYVNGICFGTSGTIYIADVFNHRIRVIGGSSTNNPPSFVHGKSAELKICANEMPFPVSLDTLLASADLDLSQTLSWSIVASPPHGSVAVVYSGSSTGGTVTPSGLSYTPPSSYLGPDDFSVRISDGTASDTMTIHVMLEGYPFPGSISGPDTVCQGGSITLADTATGGIWSTLGPKAGVSTTGTVTGLLPGADTVVYTVTNSCGSVSATHPVWVRPASECPSLTGMPAAASLLRIYPNPNTGAFTISFNDNTGHADISIHNALGQKVRAFTVTAGQPADVLLDLPAGIYIVTATHAAGTVVSKVTISR